jgi:hypothetical protein
MSVIDPINKRQSPRKRVLKTAKIYRLNGAHAMDCTLRDISETGARIVCKDQLALPNEMKLVLPMDGLMQMARVVWRKGDLAGIEFMGERLLAAPQKLQNGSMF